MIALNLLYLLVGITALPWILWRRLSNKRPVAAIRERFTGRVRVANCPKNHRRIWLHGVSVGEVQLIRTLVHELKHQACLKNQLIDCVISSSTTTGLDVATKNHESDHVFPCPLDFSWQSNRPSVEYGRMCLFSLNWRSGLTFYRSQKTTESLLWW